MIQALESYSRCFHIGKYMTDEDYESVKTALVAAIPPQTNPDLKSSLKGGKIKYGNEYSLRKRLREILSSLEDDTVALICSKPSDFCNKVVSTRNYLTHYTSELEKEAFSGEDLYWVSKRLRVLLTVLLLKELELEEPAIRTLLDGNAEIRFILDHQGK